MKNLLLTTYLILKYLELPPMTRNRVNMSVLTTSNKHFTRSSSQLNKILKRNKSHKDLKGRSKYIFIHRGHDSF